MLERKTKEIKHNKKNEVYLCGVWQGFKAASFGLLAPWNG